MFNPLYSKNTSVFKVVMHYEKYRQFPLCEATRKPSHGTTKSTHLAVNKKKMNGVQRTTLIVHEECIVNINTVVCQKAPQKRLKIILKIKPIALAIIVLRLSDEGIIQSVTRINK